LKEHRHVIPEFRVSEISGTQGGKRTACGPWVPALRASC